MTKLTADQIFLRDAQQLLGVPATEMARQLDTSWNTYKAWLYGKNPLPGVARVAVKMLLEKYGEKPVKSVDTAD